MFFTLTLLTSLLKQKDLSINLQKNLSQRALLLKKEYICKRKKNDENMNFDQLDFTTYCIGNLSARLSLPQKSIYQKLKSSGILMDYIVKGYDVLHTFSKEYLMEDLIGYMKEKGVLS